MNITNTLSALLLLSSVACSNNAKNEEDPHEEFNRDMVNFNLAVDDNVLRPAANVYKKASHNELPMSMHNFFTNLKEPYYCVNHLVCGNFEYSINSIFRLLVNSTLGILGFLIQQKV